MLTTFGPKSLNSIGTVVSYNKLSDIYTREHVPVGPFHHPRVLLICTHVAAIDPFDRYPAAHPTVTVDSTELEYFERISELFTDAFGAIEQ